MRKLTVRVASLFAIAAIAGSVTASGAGVTGTPHTSANELAFCHIAVRYAVPLNEHDGRATTWAFALDTAGAPGIATGTLHVEAGADAIEVPFTGATVASGFDSTPSTPLVYRFAGPIAVDLAFVSRLDGPNFGPCVAFGAWDPSGATRGRETPGPQSPRYPIETRDAFRQAASTAVAIPAGEALHSAASPCAMPSRPAHSVKVPPVRAPFDLPLGRNYLSYILVSLLPDGKVAETAVYHSSGSRSADAATIDSVLDSSFDAAVLKCKPMGATYIFVAEFVMR